MTVVIGALFLRETKDVDISTRSGGRENVGPELRPIGAGQGRDPIKSQAPRQTGAGLFHDTIAARYGSIADGSAARRAGAACGRRARLIALDFEPG